jgi:large subunit ribosomal protein L24
MDKILRRVRMAERQVARRAKRREQQQETSERANTRRQVIDFRRQAGSRLATAIKHRHEDWELGPLAPRRDVSRADRHGTYWGSVHAESANLSVSLTEEQREARAAWAGGARYLCLAPKDRVVVQDGPYKGKIAKILRINKETMTVDLEGVMVGDPLIPNPRMRILTHRKRPT